MSTLTLGEDVGAEYAQRRVEDILRAAGVSVDTVTGNISFSGKVIANGGATTLATAALTAITHTAPGTPDYAIADLTSTTPFGFASHDEGLTVLKVIANVQAQAAEHRAILIAAGLAA